MTGAAKRGATYLALGDSFTIGTGTTPDRSFPAVLVARYARRGIKVDLVNPSVNGYTTDDLIREELPLARALGPDLVTVLIGANDIVAGSNEERYRARVRRIHGDLVAAGLPPAALFALPMPDWSGSPSARVFGAPAELRTRIETFNGIARDEVERAGGAYVDLFPLMRAQAERAMVAPDGLHPSAEAYAEWAGALDDALVAAVRSAP